MTEATKSGLIDKVKAIAGDAQALAAALRPKAIAGADLTGKEIGAIGRLVKRSEAVMTEANRRAKQRRGEEVRELEELLASIDSALGTPGLSESALKDLRGLRRRRRAQLLHRQTREALDFGGILTARQISEIAGVLERAKQDVSSKKKAAAFLGTLLKLADAGLGIVRTAGGAL